MHHFVVMMNSLNMAAKHIDDDWLRGFFLAQALNMAREIGGFTADELAMFRDLLGRLRALMKAHPVACNDMSEMDLLLGLT